MKPLVKSLVIASLVLTGCGQHSPKLVDPSPTITSVASMSAEQVAQGLMARTLSQEDVLTVLARPADFQKEIARNIFRLQGRTEAEVSELMQRMAAESGPAVVQFGTTTTAACDQWVEHKTVVVDPSWSIGYTSMPTSRGTEYFFKFNPWWSVSPDNIRWGASDPLVFWTLYSRDFGKLWGPVLCSKPYQLLVGNTAVTLAGGAGWVQRNLYIQHT